MSATDSNLQKTFKEIDGFMVLVRNVGRVGDRDWSTYRNIFELFGIDAWAPYPQIKVKVDTFINEYRQKTGEKFRTLSKEVGPAGAKIKRILRDDREKYLIYIKENDPDIQALKAKFEGLTLDKILDEGKEFHLVEDAKNRGISRKEIAQLIEEWLSEYGVSRGPRGAEGTAGEGVFYNIELAKLKQYYVPFAAAATAFIFSLPFGIAGALLAGVSVWILGWALAPYILEFLMDQRVALTRLPLPLARGLTMGLAVCVLLIQAWPYLSQTRPERTPTQNQPVKNEPVSSNPETKTPSNTSSPIHQPQKYGDKSDGVDRFRGQTDPTISGLNENEIVNRSPEAAPPQGSSNSPPPEPGTSQPLPGEVGPRWPWTSSRPLSEDDLRGLSPRELDLMRNEIYARHGWVFNRPDLQDYFRKQDWYKPKGNVANREQVNRLIKAELTLVERNNVQFLHSRENALRNSPSSPSVEEQASQFKVGSKWWIDWQSLSHYRGFLLIQRQLEDNRYHGRITVSYLNNRNARITVSMDALLNVRGNDIIINCSNPSESWWDTDDFFLKRHNNTLTGYNVDKKGRRGKAVFELANEFNPAEPRDMSATINSSNSGTDQIQIQQVIREYYGRVAQKNVDGAMNMYATPRIPEIKRYLIANVARETDYYRFGSIQVHQSNDKNAQASIQLYHKKYNQPEETWLITMNLVKESGVWKIWSTPGKRVF